LRDEGFSREKIKKLIKDGFVRVNGQVLTLPKADVSPGARIEVILTRAPSSLAPKAGELKVLYRDAALAVLDKPAGIAVHPGAGPEQETLAHRLLAHFPELGKMEGFRPGIVHRLDKDTSGVMLVALCEESRLVLAGMLARREIHKIYLALLHGVPKRREGVIETPIGRDPANRTKMAAQTGGKAAKSAYRVLYADPEGTFSLAAIQIFSGRTHQVRLHMQSIGHPLIGEALYKSPRYPDKGAKRQMLHAFKLAFAHPLPDRAPPGSKLEMSFTCPPPADFTACALSLCRRPLRLVVTGSPGCGKSALLSALSAAGLPVFSADKVVADFYAPGGDGTRQLQARFGGRFTPDPQSGVDKAALGAAMRAEDSLRREVEALIHPLVFHALRQFWTEDARGRDFAVAEIPLYFETMRGKEKAATPDAAQGAPLVIGVRCPFAVRHERLTRLRGWKEETIAGMEAWQWPEDKKMAACDYVLDNSGSLADLEARTRDLIAFLEEERRKKDDAYASKFAALYIS
jgi:23S rRNA pseudouridine1911/1915/1917 synthase